MIQDIFSGYIPLIDAEMRQILGDDQADLAAHYGMLRYHMGWVDEQFQTVRSDGGKRIRPVLCLLACQAVGGTVDQALPAAASLELLHNFSLIHDDIEDDSPTRRHRPTVWAIWGRPQAINAGDAMFSVSRVALSGLAERGLPAEVVLDATRVFDESCLRLTEGQFLDMSFEDRLDVTSEQYLRMIGGKTAALLGASLRIGAIVGGARMPVQDSLADYGYQLGLAFQIRDDLLGIWGDERQTGKSAQSDILARKKSLPVVYALQHFDVGEALSALYSQPIFPDDVQAVMALLDQCGARVYAEDMAASAHRAALDALQASGVLEAENGVGQALLQISRALLDRQK
ncbi:MAG: polyprenyl synthetase family protein [Chloroflexota bacterium]|nr:polyprenyl synthetase family protein [Chloroflexota bacterium]